MCIRDSIYTEECAEIGYLAALAGFNDFISEEDSLFIRNIAKGGNAVQHLYIMNNFEYYAPTKIVFGVGEFENLGREVNIYGKRALLVEQNGPLDEMGVFDSAIRYMKDCSLSLIHIQMCIRDRCTSYLFLFVLNTIK